MRRDMDLVRDILLEMEKRTAKQRGDEIVIAGHTPEEINYHIGLMHQAGLLKAANATSFDGVKWIAIDILWPGHEFLDDARSDTVWEKAKQRAMTTAGALSLEALKVALQFVIRQAVGGP